MLARHNPIPAPNHSDVCATMEVAMLLRVFAVMFIAGLLVTVSAAIVAGHQRTLIACASGCD
jgi:hypothetical protein